jgi:hypothetical protein
MKLLDINGYSRFLNVSKCRIDWDKPSRSKIQFQVKNFLKEFWENDIVYEEFPVYGRKKMKVDILNATKKIAVEVNGSQHDKFNPFFHGKSRIKYLASIKRDTLKAEWLALNKFDIIEIEASEVDGISAEFILNKFKLHL